MEIEKSCEPISHRGHKIQKCDTDKAGNGFQIMRPGLNGKQYEVGRAPSIERAKKFVDDKLNSEWLDKVKTPSRTNPEVKELKPKGGGWWHGGE